jgi:chromosomal replication initiation ATPase DnaA
MLRVIASTLGMDATCYKQKSRSRQFVELRFIASHFLRIYFPTLTLLNISHYFGALDHATIINGLTRTKEMLATGDERFLTKYENVLNSVNQWLQKEMLGYGSAISA